MKITMHLIKQNTSFLNYKMQCNTLLFNKLKETPDAPRMVKIFCEETSASVQWISSFNGGDTQEFAVVVSNGHFETSYSDFIPDTGENEIHSKIIQNLQPSSEYLFSVSAHNKLGESTSEKFKCTTKQKGFNFFFRFQEVVKIVKNKKRRHFCCTL